MMLEAFNSMGNRVLDENLSVAQLFKKCPVVKGTEMVISVLTSATNRQGKVIHINRLWRPIGLWDFEAPTFSTQSTHRWRWGCQPCAPAALFPPGSFLVLISIRGWVDPRAIVRLEGLRKLKNPMTSLRIELYNNNHSNYPFIHFFTLLPNTLFNYIAHRYIFKGSIYTVELDYLTVVLRATCIVHPVDLYLITTITEWRV
jgi:hypothetical protein